MISHWQFPFIKDIDIRRQCADDSRGLIRQCRDTVSGLHPVHTSWRDAVSRDRTRSSIIRESIYEFLAQREVAAIKQRLRIPRMRFPLLIIENRHRFGAPSLRTEMHPANNQNIISAVDRRIPELIADLTSVLS